MCNYEGYCKIVKISPRAYIFQSPLSGVSIWRGLSTEGNLNFHINLASLIAGPKFTVLALFNFVFEDFQVQVPKGGGGGLIFGGVI